MDTETKQLAAMAAIVGLCPFVVVVAMVSQRFRDIALFAFTFGTVLMGRMDVMLFGEFWYRGTARGIQLSILDVLPVALLVATVLFPRYPRGRFYWPASFGLVVLFFLYCCGSVYFSDPRYYGVWELAKMARGVMVFLAAALFIRTKRELGIVVAALSLSALMQGFNGIEQRLFKGATRPPGTLDHANTLSTYLCLIAPVLVAAAMANWSKWLRMLAGAAWLMAAGAELLTLSRMGIPVFVMVSAGTAVACSSWRPSWEKFAVVAMAAIAIAVFLPATWPALKQRYIDGDVRAEFTDESGFETRGVYVRIARAMAEDHFYGVGLNNWSYYVSKVYGPYFGYRYVDYDDVIDPTKEELPHILLPPAADSLPSLTVGELGIPGSILFLLLWLRWLQMGTVFLGNRLNADPMHRVGIGILFGIFGTFLQSVTEWTYKQPGVYFTAFVMVGALASMYRARKLAKKEAKRRAEDGEPEDETDPEVIEAEVIDERRIPVRVSANPAG